MAIAARLEGNRLLVDFDPAPGQGMPELFNAVAAISGDYANVLAATAEIVVSFAQADAERGIFSWLQGAMKNGKVVTLRPTTQAAWQFLRGEETLGRKTWNNLLSPEAAGARRATRPLMRPTSKIRKPDAP